MHIINLMKSFLNTGTSVKMTESEKLLDVRACRRNWVLGLWCAH